MAGGVERPGPAFLGMPEPVGKYELRAALGTGAFGTVYLGYQRDLDRAVAIKELLPRFAADPGYIERFRGEAAVMARLNSARCVRVYDFLEVDGRALLVSEFVDGASLEAVIEHSGRLTPEQALGVLKGALSGLADANREGLVHRDVKPANLLADRDGVSKLADFGQAYAVGGEDLFGGGATGTAAYMSPEQVRRADVDHRSDIYSCGAVLFELLAGRAPFVGDSPTAVMRMHLEQAPPDLRKVARDLPQGVARLVQRAMAKDPAERPADADQLLLELEAAAVAGYGSDWESRSSIRRLVEAAALALGLLGLGAALGTTTAGAAAAGSATVGGTTVGSAGAGSAAGGSGAATGTSAAGSNAVGGSGASAGGAAATSALGRFATPLALGVAAVILVGALLAALAHVGPFAPPPGGLATSLADAFGPALAGGAGGQGNTASGVPSFFAGPNGTVVERVAFTSPASVPLGFSYCDAFTCGNSDNVDCIGNSYVPSFGGAVPLSVRLAPPPGVKIDRALVSAGPAPGADTALALFDAASPSGSRPSLLTAAPGLAPDGALALEFATPWRSAMEPHFNAKLARYCGFSKEQRAAFSSSYGSAYRNPYPIITVLVRWAAPSSLDGLKTSVSLNGAVREVPVAIAAGARRPGTPAVLLQGDPRWSATPEGHTTLGSSGTVATAVASILSALGTPTTPPMVAQDLIRSGAWKPASGTDWTGLVGYLNTRAAATEIDLPEAAANARAGRLALAALTDGGGGPGRETVVVVSGYNAARDTFTVIDPRLGQLEWSWDRVADANPWIVAVDPRPAP